MRNEYPRPHFKRDFIQSLNGERGFGFDDDNKYFNRNKPTYKALPKTIIVPFAYQTERSGLHDESQHEIMWYEKTFDLDASLKGKNVLLHFNAVDHETHVFLNDEFVGHHIGGYTHFSFDVTKYLKDKNNKLVVRVHDPYDPAIPRGKQYWEAEPSRCWYVASSGIWQSVWLESFNVDYIERAFITPDIDTNSVTFEIESRYAKANLVSVEVSYKGKLVKRSITSFDNHVTTFTLRILEADYIDEIHYWEIDNPHLYDVKLKLLHETEIYDEVTTYFGFRKIHTDETGQIYLNNKRLYQRLVLDQGYFPKGDLTPASVEEFKNDILLAREMGFNGIRKHQKIEDPYFYYYADQLGFLVWAELPSSYHFNHHEVNYITDLLQKTIKQLYNHPSIITWVPFNESWGVRKLLVDAKQKDFVRSMYYLTRTLDKTRLVNSNDGWEQVEETDLIAIHDYDTTGANFIEKYKRDNIQDVQPMGRKLMGYGEQYKGQAVILSEYGGISEKNDVQDGFYGYRVAENKEMLLKEISNLQNIVDACGFNGFCYTQLTDVKQETNGLLYIDRKPKLDLAELRKIFGEK